MSEKYEIMTAVPQGSPLLPNLFKIAMKKISKLRI
jgi:hypothetical protein